MKVPKIQTNTPAQPRPSGKGLPTGWIAVIALIVIVAGLVIWQAPALMSPSPSSGNGGNSDYSQLNLVSGISITYEQGGNSYVFSYRLTAADNSGLFYVSENVQQSRSFPAVAGAVYSDLGLELKVTSVTSELLVLQVKPLPD